MSTMCPFCDSKNVEIIEVSERFPIPFCDDAIITHKTFRCNSCEEEGDFDHTLDKELTKTIDDANIASAPMLLDGLSKIGITMTYLEKALRLPFRTTARWKKGNISHAALALLRFVHFSPALLHVADNNFSREAVDCYQIFHPLEYFTKNTRNPGLSVTIEGEQVGVKFTGNVSSNATSSLKQEVKWIS